MKTTYSIILIYIINVTLCIIQKRLIIVFSGFYVNIKFLQSFVIIFINLTSFLLVNLINELSTKKKKVGQARFCYYLNINIP